MYLAAPINAFYGPDIAVSEGAARVGMTVLPTMFHGAGAAHGSVVFKMLDDASFFSAALLERTSFVVTTTFTTYLTRPVSSGRIVSVGRVVNRNRTQFIAEAVLTDARGREIGRGSGVFSRSAALLTDTAGYAS